MSLANTLDRIANGFEHLATGPVDGITRGALEQDLAQAFRQLKVDLAAKTGWAAATGTATRTTFDTATVTTANLAQRVKALLDDLLSRGDISA